MKIIHVADIHIGSKFNKIDDDKKKNTLSSDLTNSFRRVVDYAKANNIQTILLSGDIFDKDRVVKSEKNYFYDVINGNPNINFYYIKGNHDQGSTIIKEFDNLFTFENNGMYKHYDLGDDVVVYGYELQENNENLYNMPSLNANNYNILMLHGDISSSAVDHKIEISRLKDKNINYMALGHIHSFSDEMIGKNTHIVYPGCLMGRGFDELGSKGFVVLDTENKTNPVEFVPLKNKEFAVEKIDVTELSNQYELEEHLKDNIQRNPNKLLEIVLEGKRGFEIKEDNLRSLLKDYVYFVNIKNSTRQKLSTFTDIDERSLKGMFIKTVKEDPNLSEDEKEEILRYGLSKIEKGEQ